MCRPRRRTYAGPDVWRQPNGFLCPFVQEKQSAVYTSSYIWYLEHMKYWIREFHLRSWKHISVGNVVLYAITFTFPSPSRYFHAFLCLSSSNGGTCIIKSRPLFPLSCRCCSKSRAGPAWATGCLAVTFSLPYISGNTGRNLANSSFYMNSLSDFPSCGSLSHISG